MSAAAAGAVLLAAVLLQVTWLFHLSVLGSDPNLALLAVAGWTWLRGPRAGLGWALAAGLLLDLGSAGPIGVHAIALLAAAYCVGLIGGSLKAGGVLVPAAAAAIATLLYGLIVIGAGETLGQAFPPPAVARVLLLGGALYNAILMPLILFPLRRLDGLLAGPVGELW